MKMYRSHSLWPKQTAIGIRLQRQGWGGDSLLPQGVGQDQWVDLVRALQTCRTEHQPYFLEPPFPPPPTKLGELEGLREKTEICLWPHSPPRDHHSTVVWIPSLTVAPWQFLACGRGPVGHQPRTGWNHCLVTMCEVVMYCNDWILRAVLTALC